MSPEEPRTDVTPSITEFLHTLNKSGGNTVPRVTIVFSGGETAELRSGDVRRGLVNVQAGSVVTRVTLAPDATMDLFRRISRAFPNLSVG